MKKKSLTAVLVLAVLIVILAELVVLNQYALKDKARLVPQSALNLNEVKLDLNDIFNPNYKIDPGLSRDELRTIIVSGDVIPARSVNSQVLKYKDFTWPYLKTADITKNADITFINLETPIIENCPVTSEGMIFCGDSKNIEGLKYAGVDVVSLANNHAGNYGEKGVEETIKLLDDNGIKSTGTAKSNLSIVNLRGINFAFLGYNDITKFQPGVSNVDEEKIKKEIREAKNQAEVVVVTFHWGEEYKDQPDDRQRYLGHLAVDAGADLVIGNHPHWIQPVEIYQNKLIAYAHGNFVFDQMWSQETKEGVIGKYTFYKSQLIDIKFIPIQIENYGQPYILSDNKRDRILNEMFAKSIKLSTTAN